MPGEVSHPVFARFFDRFSRAMEPELGPMRDELVSGLEGRVLELGSGNGINFSRYPSSVQEVIAIEPEPYLRGRSTEAAASARFLEHVRGTGSAKQRVQRALDRSRLWPGLVGGCHCSRDTVAAVRRAGFEVQEVRTVDLGPGWMVTNPHVLGVARAA